MSHPYQTPVSWAGTSRSTAAASARVEVEVILCDSDDHGYTIQGDEDAKPQRIQKRSAKIIERRSTTVIMEMKEAKAIELGLV